MRFDEQITIAASPERVWAVYADVTRWSEWTESITSVELLDGATALALGVRARIHQPKLPAAVWAVTELEPGRSWTWVAKAPGARTSATHTVVPDGDGTRVESSLTQAGPIGWLIGHAYESLTRRYLAMEAEGLQRRALSANS